jgi:regulator of sigma E protease
MSLNEILSVALLVFGFGFVIFFHELGHFLAAKYVGIKVEQFAVGFGQAIFSWRKGMGFTLGSSNKKYDELVARSNENDMDASQIGETEYRLNWIPLGGYVKMLGQDDMKPNAAADDPRAYNRKSIGARMLVVSAGVIMNIILAAIGFMVVFLIGFNAPPSVVGSVTSNSPAQAAGIRVGDEILYFDGKRQHDFTKITLYPALVKEGSEVPVQVKRVNGAIEDLTIKPARLKGEPNGFLMIGIGQPHELRGLDPKKAPDFTELEKRFSAAALAIRPGDEIKAIITPAGDKIAISDASTEYYKFDDVLQASKGHLVKLIVADKSGNQREVTVQPGFVEPFTKNPLNFMGMVPRVEIAALGADSPAIGQVEPGDIVTEIVYSNGEIVSNPSLGALKDRLGKLSESGQTFTLTLLRNGMVVQTRELTADAKLETGGRGLNVNLDVDAATPIVAEVLDESPAQNIPVGSTITAINSQPVQSWHDVKAVLDGANADKPIEVKVELKDGGVQTFAINLSKLQLKAVQDLRYSHDLFLKDYIKPRKTTNPLEAASWGVVETRDFILQFYLTLQRMVQGSVSYTNMMGPVGIFHAGTKFAFKGTDWLIWFLAMISANLAVVNFLPIPIVDGGLFTFLIIEKIQGKPLSARTQTIAQVVGLAMILGVFLLVTYQDIVRFL